MEHLIEELEPNVTVLEAPIIDANGNNELPSDLFVSLAVSTCCNLCCHVCTYMCVFDGKCIYILTGIQCKDIFCKYLRGQGSANCL